jgi:RNase P protein component
VALEPGWDIILIARPKVTNASYANLNKSVRGLLLQAGLLKVDKEKHS